MKSEYACKELVFSFNRGYLSDPTIPMWLIRARGQSFYCNHVEAKIGWSTKETPDNEHTKGSIKFKDVLLTIDRDSNAIIDQIKPSDLIRIKNQEKGIHRFVTYVAGTVRSWLIENKIKHGPFKHSSGGCGNSFWVFEVKGDDNKILMLLGLGQKIRSLSPHEGLYRFYDSNDDLDIEEEDFEDIDD